jgi:hypothetical protein
MFIMKLAGIVCALSLAQVQVQALAFSPNKHSISVDRRNALIAGITATSAILLSPSSAFAQGAEAFIGTFSDPINHPGGRRTIRLVGEKIGDYQLAEVLGGGGKGEPANYILPAAIIGDRTIVIDFSPKGGPR